MKNIKYPMKLGVTEAFTNRMTEATKAIGQRNIKGDTNNCCLFYIWFSLKKLAESVMNVRT